MGSVLGGQHKGRRRSIGFRDDPDLHTPVEEIGGEDAEMAAKRELVLAAIIRAEVAPIAALMTDEQRRRRRAGVLQGLKGTGRCDDGAQREERSTPGFVVGIGHGVHLLSRGNG